MKTYSLYYPKLEQAHIDTLLKFARSSNAELASA